MCRTNATGYNYRDGTTVCSVQGGFIVYFVLTAVLSWFSIILEVFLVTRLKWDPILSKSKQLYTACVLSFIYVPPLLVLFSSPWFGYSRSYPFCLYAYTEAKDLDFFVFFVPVGIITLMGVVLLIPVVVTLLLGQGRSPADAPTKAYESLEQGNCQLRLQ